MSRSGFLPTQRRPTTEIASIILLFIFISAVAGSWLDDGATQYIYYDGEISGSLTPTSVHNITSTRCEDGTRYFSDLTNSSLLIGVNAPWDSNPFFFYIEHDGNPANSTWRAERGLTTGRSARRQSTSFLSPRQVIFTDDPIYNLEFGSAYLVCEKDGVPCGFLEEWPWYFVSAEILNLNHSTVTRVNSSISATDRGPYYSVFGDQSSWISNGTVSWSEFDWQTPLSYSTLCDMSFSWNDSTPFTYNLNFTNTTATANFTLTYQGYTTTILFSGTREDTQYTIPSEGVSIALAPIASNPLPHFTFANGSEIAFHTYGDGSWSANVTSSSSSDASSTKHASVWFVWTMISIAVTLAAYQL